MNTKKTLLTKASTAIFKIGLLLLIMSFVTGKASMNPDMRNEKKIGIVFLIDRSGSYEDIHIPVNFFEDLMSNLSQSFDSFFLAVKSFAAFDTKPFARYYHEFPYSEGDDELTLSERLEQKLKNDKLKEESMVLEAQFLKDVNSQISRKLDTLRTCLNETFSLGKVLMNEPQHSSYTKYIILLTDGEQDCDGDNKIESINKSNDDSIHLITIGWTHDETLPNSLKIADMSGLIHFFKNLNN